MADDNIVSISINSLLLTLVMMGLLSGYILMVNNEGRGEVFNGYSRVNEFNLNLTNLYSQGQVINITNVNSNLSSNYNAEQSLSGADKTGNAIAENNRIVAKQGLTSLSLAGELLFGNVWNTLLFGIIMSLFSALSTYYFVKWVRSGT